MQKNSNILHERESVTNLIKDIAQNPYEYSLDSILKLLQSLLRNDFDNIKDVSELKNQYTYYEDWKAVFEGKKQENIKTEKPKKAVVDNTEVVKGQDKTEPKKAGRPKKVEVKVETIVEEKPKKAGRPKKEAEDKGAEPVKTTRKKKGVTEDATSND